MSREVGKMPAPEPSISVGAAGIPTATLAGVFPPRSVPMPACSLPPVTRAPRPRGTPLTEGRICCLQLQQAALNATKSAVVGPLHVLKCKRSHGAVPGGPLTRGHKGAYLKHAVFRSRTLSIFWALRKTISGSIPDKAQGTFSRGGEAA